MNNDWNDCIFFLCPMQSILHLSLCTISGLSIYDDIQKMSSKLLSSAGLLQKCLKILANGKLYIIYFMWVELWKEQKIEFYMVVVLHLCSLPLVWLAASSNFTWSHVNIYIFLHCDRINSLSTFRLVAFNLGYLPGGDKGIITISKTTLLALEAAKKMLIPGGLISLVVYVGHPGGR